MPDKEKLKIVYNGIIQKNNNLVIETLESEIGLISYTLKIGSWLHIAAMRGNHDIIVWLVENGLDADTHAGPANGGPINVASAEGHLNIVQYLFCNGASLDTDKPEKNPLFAAIVNGYMDVAKFLIESGIDIHARYNYGEEEMGAVEFAEQYGRSDIVKLLKTAGA